MAFKSRFFETSGAPMKECFLSDAIELCCCSVYGIFAKTVQGKDNYPEVMVVIIEYCHLKQTFIWGLVSIY